MKTIKKGIVFSYDIQNILNGYNAINYSYTNNDIMIPANNYIKTIRKDFEKTVNKIFTQTTIITEDEMQDSIYTSIQDVISRYPHRITRQNISKDR